MRCRSAALHTPRDPIAAITGADFPTSYFQRLLLDLIPACEMTPLRCFIMDDKGYIITHPYMSTSGFSEAPERQHLTHVVSVCVICHRYMSELHLRVNINAECQPSELYIVIIIVISQIYVIIIIIFI